MSSSDNKPDLSTLWGTLGVTLLTGGVVGGSVWMESSSQESWGGAAEPFSLIHSAKDTSLELNTDSGDSLGLYTVTCMIASAGASSEQVIFRGFGIEVVEESSGGIITREVKNSNKVEKNAEMIYNTFNKNHEIKDIETGLLFPNIETAKKLDEILKNGTKEEIYQALTAIQEVLEEKDKEENITLKLEK